MRYPGHEGTSGLPDNRYILVEVVVRRPGTSTGRDLAVTSTVGGTTYRQVAGRRDFSVVAAKP